jgi:hypothetical protein
MDTMLAFDIAAAADALVGGLRTILSVTYVPLIDSVARLDTTTPTWILYLDSDSPVEDHCWAMIDVLKVLTLGVGAAASARHAPRLALVRD